MLAPPDWITLSIFLAAVELGSVTRAASHYGIATSAAAKRVQDLETEYGVRLLERSARGVRATAAGEVLARHARTLLDLAARLADDLRALAAGGLGIVRLHATASAIIGHGLAEALAAFATARPGIKVELREETSPAIVRSCLTAWRTHTGQRCACTTCRSPSVGPGAGCGWWPGQPRRCWHRRGCCSTTWSAQHRERQRAFMRT